MEESLAFVCYGKHALHHTSLSVDQTDPGLKVREAAAGPSQATSPEVLDPACVSSMAGHLAMRDDVDERQVAEPQSAGLLHRSRGGDARSRDGYKCRGWATHTLCY